ncbi:MAG: hypothetical protein RL674_1529, partial [Pseudomonadota bacterium]
IKYKNILGIVATFNNIRIIMQSLYYLTSVSAVKCPPLTVISP